MDFCDEPLLMELRDVQHFGETSVLGEELVSLQDFNFVFFDAALDPTSLSADFKHGILQEL